MRIVLIILLITLLLVAPGCGTLIATADARHPTVYGGIQVDLITGAVLGPLSYPFVLADFTLSLVADTLLLPIGIFYPGYGPRLGGC